MSDIILMIEEMQKFSLKGLRPSLQKAIRETFIACKERINLDGVEKGTLRERANQIENLLDQANQKNEELIAEIALKNEEIKSMREEKAVAAIVEVIEENKTIVETPVKVEGVITEVEVKEVDLNVIVPTETVVETVTETKTES